MFNLRDHLWRCSLNKMQTRNDSDRKNLNERDYGEKIKNCGWKGGNTSLRPTPTHEQKKHNFVCSFLFSLKYFRDILQYNITPIHRYESFKFFKEENKINFKIKQKQFSFQNIYLFIQCFWRGLWMIEKNDLGHDTYFQKLFFDIEKDNEKLTNMLTLRFLPHTPYYNRR